jgi:NTE family protein
MFARGPALAALITDRRVVRLRRFEFGAGRPDVGDRGGANRFGTCCAGLLCVLLTLVGCASAPRKAGDVVPPSTGPIELERSSRPTLALVLGGGALRGFAHVGVVKVLEEHGIRPDLLVGTSAGSFVAALYAAGYQAQELEQLALNMERRQLVDYSLWWFGLVKGEALQDYVNEHVNRRPIEALQIPFAAVATDFQTGQLKVLNRGDTGMAVRASSSIPGLFHPVVIDGRRYVDGSLVSPIPVCVARHMGADLVIAVDVWYPPEQTALNNPLNIPFQMMHIMAQALSAHQIKAADVAIRPDIRAAGEVSFNSKRALIAVGEKAALAAVPQIKRLLASHQAHTGTQASARGCPPMNGSTTPYQSLLSRGD